MTLQNYDAMGSSHSSPITSLHSLTRSPAPLQRLFQILTIPPLPLVLFSVFTTAARHDVWLPAFDEPPATGVEDGLPPVPAVPASLETEPLTPLYINSQFSPTSVDVEELRAHYITSGGFSTVYAFPPLWKANVSLKHFTALQLEG